MAGKEMSFEACQNVMRFLATWHAEKRGQTLSDPCGVSIEDVGMTEEDLAGTEVLGIVYEGGAWRVEVRLPDGSRTSALHRKSSVQAMSKAIHLGRLAGRRAAS